MKKFQFELTEDEANVILAGLQELPAKVCNPLSQKLIEQAKEQMPGRTINQNIDESVQTTEQLG
jgi:hypothetical protein